MKATYVSTQSIATNQRSILSQLQRELTKNATEVTTGRHADVGLVLGSSAGVPVSLRAEGAKLATMVDSNEVLLSSLSLSQLNLQGLRDGVDVFKDSLLAVPGQNRDADVLADEAETALATFYAALNGTDGTRYLFAGANSDVPPMVAYDASVGADGTSLGPQQLVDGAFAAFMAAQVPPITDAADLTAEQIGTFLDGEFAALFDEPYWTQTWSTATDEGRSTRISPTETATTSVSANEEPFRRILMGYVMVAKLQTPALNKDALEVVMKKSEEALVAAYSDVGDLEARLGNVESRISAANRQMELKIDLIEKHIDTYEGVDVAEAKTRVDLLATQIEMSYSLTNRLLSLSILDYA